MSLDILEYQGRVPKRAGSLAKRDTILSAALTIIQDEGLRGVRHRAVADLAKVPLSATTYYFKDINELIVDSFVYFIELNFNKQEAVFKNIEQDFLENTSTNFQDSVPIKYFHNVLNTYLLGQISDRNNRLIERSFIQYASRIPKLAEKVLQIQQFFEDHLRSIIKSLGIKDSKFKAHSLLAFINLTEERALLAGDVNEQELSNNIELLLKDLFN